MDFLLHVGHGHPDMLWIGVSTILAFVLGIGIAAYGLDLGSDPVDDPTADDR